MKTQNKVDKFIKDEMKFQSDKSEKSTMANDKKIVRGGQEFTDQFYSQHMRFWKGVCKDFIVYKIYRSVST